MPGGSGCGGPATDNRDAGSRRGGRGCGLMPRLPRISGREAVTVFERAGFETRRQHGSHIIMTKPGRVETLSVPDHRELQMGTLRTLIRKAGLSVESSSRGCSGADGQLLLPILDERHG